MQIQITTDKNIAGSDRLQAYLEDKLTTALKRFESRISRLEAHLADENGPRSGDDDKRCVLEARLDGLNPIAVTAHAAEIEPAVNAAITKLKAALDTAVGKLSDHHRQA